MEKKTIGNLIKTRRKEKGLSQKQLAELLLVSDTTISKWETGVNLPDVLILKRIAEVLNIPLTEFLEVDDKASVDDADYDNYKKKGFDDITDSYSILYP